MYIPANIGCDAPLIASPSATLLCSTPLRTRDPSMVSLPCLGTSKQPYPTCDDGNFLSHFLLCHCILRVSHSLPRRSLPHPLLLMVGSLGGLPERGVGICGRHCSPSRAGDAAISSAVVRWKGVVVAPAERLQMGSLDAQGSCMILSGRTAM